VYFRTRHTEIRIRLNKFALLTIPGDLKGTVNQKIEWGIIYLPGKNNFQILFFRNLEEKNLLSANMKNALNGEKSKEIKHISVNFRTT
jgi:hypothetical protein